MKLLKFEGLLFTLRESRRTSGFAERVVNFTDTQMHLLAKIYSLKILFKSGVRLQFEVTWYLSSR